MSHTRVPAVANVFYPGNPQILAQLLANLLTNTSTNPAPPKAMIVPHAGYKFSGAIAAEAFAPLVQVKKQIKRVVLLGPSHRVRVDGLAAPLADSFTTPLGQVRVDQPVIQRLVSLPYVVTTDAPHEKEHSLEVELPFLQTVLDDFALVPLAVGLANPVQVATVLEYLWGGPETLIVISSDLSHYHDYDTTKEMDAFATQAILNKSIGEITPEYACGSRGINGALLVAEKMGLQTSLVAACNSGDSQGLRERAVGYGSYYIGKLSMDDIQFAPDIIEALYQTAKESIHYGALHGEVMPEFSFPKNRYIHTNFASFVTLTSKATGQLRGCRGSLFPHRPLGVDVMQNAYASAFKDDRFTPVTKDELDDLDISITLLHPPEDLIAPTEASLLSQMRPGKDGIMLFKGEKRGILLPHVWESLPEPEDFLAAVKRKAKLDSEEWDEQMIVKRFTASIL